MNKFVALMRRYCNDYTNRQDLTVCDEIMVPDYTLHMGTYDLQGRDESYKPASKKQFEQFPGLCLTVNEIVTNGDRLLMHFTEHGASLRHDSACAAWGGIGLYKWNGEMLTENFVEQDYYSRREQLASGKSHPVAAAAIAPWDTQAQSPNLDAETTVRDFLETGDLTSIAAIVFDDVWAGRPLQRVIEPTAVQINDLFSAGDKVAFHITQYGLLHDDFTGTDKSLQGREVILHMSGLLTVVNGEIACGRVIRDRLGLYRRLAT
jgi:predicted ester cyclase